MNRTGIEWTSFTWNPVTGCNHGCRYCYARDLALGRFRRRYPSGFNPMIWPGRLFETAPKLPARIFVCSMGDLFGSWVPDEWIEQVFGYARKHPQHTFQFLTKNPARYWDVECPLNAWYGTTVDGPHALDRIDAVRGLDRTTFVSFEPLTEPIDPVLTGIDWVIIGGRSRGGGLPKVVPDPAWIRTIIDAAREAGAAVFVKNNAVSPPAKTNCTYSWPREFPSCEVMG